MLDSPLSDPGVIPPLHNAAFVFLQGGFTLDSSQFRERFEQGVCFHPSWVRADFKRDDV